MKGEFDAAQKIIGDLRKAGDLPIEIASEDGARKFTEDGFDLGADPSAYDDDGILAWADDIPQHALAAIEDALAGQWAFGDVALLVAAIRYRGRHGCREDRPVEHIPPDLSGLWHSDRQRKGLE